MPHRLRRRAGMPMSKTHASAVPPFRGRKSFLAWLRAELADVVFTVRVTACAVERVILTEGGMLHVAGGIPIGEVIMQLRLTTPVNPPEGVRLTVEVFPVVAPRAMLIAVPVMEKLGTMGTIVYVALDAAL